MAARIVKVDAAKGIYVNAEHVTRVVETYYSSTQEWRTTIYVVGDGWVMVDGRAADIVAMLNNTAAWGKS